MGEGKREIKARAPCGVIFRRRDRRRKSGREGNVRGHTGRQRDVQADPEKVLERVPLVRQKQGIVGQRAHGESNLLEVKEILQRRDFAQEDPVGDRVGREEGRGEVVWVSGFATVRSEYECVCIICGQFPLLFSHRGTRKGTRTERERGLTESSRSSESIQARHIGVHVVQPTQSSAGPNPKAVGQKEVDEDPPVAVRGRLLCIPHTCRRELAIQTPFRLALVVDTVEPDHTLEEDMELGVGRGVFGHFK